MYKILILKNKKNKIPPNGILKEPSKNWNQKNILIKNFIMINLDLIKRIRN